jgi:cytidyltransferase-like protein
MNIKKMDSWSKKLHVGSSLPSKDGQFAMFVGRWQPLHKGHQELFKRAMDEGKNVLICIRDIKPDEKNPYSADQVRENISDFYSKECEEGKVKVMVIPDICSIEFGRGVGYDIIEHIPPQEIHDISATKIREELKKQGKL